MYEQNVTGCILNQTKSQQTGQQLCEAVLKLNANVFNVFKVKCLPSSSPLISVNQVRLRLMGISVVYE